MAPAVERRERRRLVSSDRSTSPVRDRQSPHRKASSRREASPAYRKSMARSPDRAHRVRSPVKETSSDRIRSPRHGGRASTVRVDSSRSPSPRTKRLRRAQAEREAHGVADRECGRSSGREDNDKGRYKERAELVSRDRKSLKEKNDAALSKSSSRDPANSPEGRSHKERRSSRSPARASVAVVRNKVEKKTGPAEYSRRHMNHERPSKRPGVPIVRPFLGFSSFARTILFSRSAPAYSPSAFAESPVDEDEEQEVDMVHADFGFFDPKLGDFSGVKLLLHNYLDNKPWDLSGFVDLILEQTTVGTVVKLDEQDEVGHADDDDAGPFGVISALNLQRYQHHRCIKELKEFLLEACTEEATKKKLKTYLQQQAGDVGLLVSQRFVNCPYQLVPPLYDALFDEIAWATEDEPTQELRDSFCFKYYVLVTRILEHQSKTIKQSKANSKGDVDFMDSIIYIKPEDEIFQELSSLSFTFALCAVRASPSEMKNYKEKGLVMVIDASEVSKFREKLKCLLAEC